jgi:hypothetical protein
MDVLAELQPNNCANEMWTFIGRSIGTPCSSFLRNAVEGGSDNSLFRSTRLYTCLCSLVFEYWLTVQENSSQDVVVNNDDVVDSPLRQLMRAISLPAQQTQPIILRAVSPPTEAMTGVVGTPFHDNTRNSDRNDLGFQDDNVDVQVNGRARSDTGCSGVFDISAEDNLKELIETVCNDEEVQQLQVLLQHPHILGVINNTDPYVRRIAIEYCAVFQ